MARSRDRLSASRLVFQASQAGPDPRHGTPCHLCSGRCCRYFALEINRPVTPADHDQVRWFLLHEGTTVWVLDGNWHLEIRSRCGQLREDNSCAIYDRRPEICREYGAPDIDAPCEFFDDGKPYDLHFGDAASFEAWSRVELERREQRLARRRERHRRRIARSQEAIA